MTVSAFDAATIILLRDRPLGPEVFMLRRHAAASFMAGAYVFPGGKVDDHDRSFPPHLVDDPTVTDLPVRVAAIRETFEECGVLLAVGPGGEHPTAGELDADDAREARARLQAHDRSWNWAGWLQERSLTLQAGELGFASWWITPEGEPKRFDTRFFMAAVPSEQDARHDDVETTHSAWVRPAEALEIADRGEAFIVPPTRKNLEALVGHDTAAGIIETVRRTPDPTPIVPKLLFEEGRVLITHESFDPIEVTHVKAETPRSG